MAATAATLLSYLRLPVLVSTAFAALASTLLYFKQNELIYPRTLPPGSRTPAGVPRPADFAIPHTTTHHLPTPDGETLHAYLLRPPNPRLQRPLSLLLFHGNAGNIGHRLPIARVLAERLGARVLLLEYRGYGLSSGTPDERGLGVDARTGLAWLRGGEETGGDVVVVVGQSLGGAVAVGLCVGDAGGEGVGVGGVVLENTFLSMRKMIPAAFPPARYLAPLCHQIWPTEEMIGEIRDVPMLFLSGLKDEIVPPSHMKTLYELSRARIKIWKELPNGHHNDTVAEPGYFDAIVDFVNEHVLKE